MITERDANLGLLEVNCAVLYRNPTDVFLGIF